MTRVRSVSSLCAARLVALPLLCALVAACTASDRQQSPASDQPALDASITQFRHDEGTRNLRAGVTNMGSAAVTVTRATLSWSGFAPTSVELEPWTLEPGRTAGFTLQYGAARCESEPTDRPRLDVVVDGREHWLPLTVEDPELLERLYANECAEQRLDATGTVSLRLADAPVERAGEEYLPGDVLIRRKPGSTDRLTVVDVGGSVLLRLTPKETGALPTHLDADQRSLRVPVLVGSAHRCDAHALGNSSQTFLLSVYVRRGQDPVHRVITVPDRGSKALLTELIARDCR